MQLGRVAQNVEQWADIVACKLVFNRLHCAVGNGRDSRYAYRRKIKITHDLLYVRIDCRNQVRDDLFSNLDRIIHFLRHLLLKRCMGGLLHIVDASGGRDHVGFKLRALLLHAGGRLGQRRVPDGRGSVDQRAGHHVIHLRAVGRGHATDAQCARMAGEEILHAGIRKSTRV